MAVVWCGLDVLVVSGVDDAVELGELGGARGESI